jgi:F420-dependent oxidoreductase-like protein
MRFGMQHSNRGYGRSDNRWDTVRAVAVASEEAGIDSCWLPDHFQYGAEIPVLECWVTLGALAAVTTRLRLGALVSGIPYRNPALLAKMGATLDVISHGRCIMGIGAGWHREEFDAYGYAFETAAARGARLEEAAQVVRAMLSQQRTTFEGRYYRVTDAYNEPRPIQQPHPPLLIGGNGEKVTLRVVARYGDMCNLTGTPDEVRQRLAILREHCRAVGRPYEEITRTTFGWLLIGRTEEEAAAKRARYMQREPFAGIAGTPPRIVARLREYAAAGVQYFLFSMPDAHEIEPLRLFGEEVLPALADV